MVGRFKLSDRATRSKYLLVSVALFVQLTVGSMLAQTASATPTFDSYPISTTYDKAGEMTVAGGDLWYLQRTASNGPVDSIGRVTTSGVVTDYSIGYPPNQTSFTAEQLITGPDSNVWFMGSGSSGATLGKLDITTGAVTFRRAGGYTPGKIAAGNGRVYYTGKSSTSPKYAYVIALDPSTGATSSVWSYEDDYTNISGIAVGSDGRLYLTDAYQYYNRIYAVSVTGGTNSTFYLPDNATGITSGPDGNLWFTVPGVQGKIYKMTTAGLKTAYDLPAGTSVNRLAAGPDGAVWFLGDSEIGRISTTGVITTYDLPDGGSAWYVSGLVSGPDNAMWFNFNVPNDGYKIGRISATPTFDSYPISSTYAKPRAMTVAEGDLWYLESSGSAGSAPIDSIGRMTVSGTTTDYSIGHPSGQTSFEADQLITGPDGNPWFMGSGGGISFLGRLDISTGAVTFYSLGGSTPGEVTAGVDDKLYYTIRGTTSPVHTYLMAFDPATGSRTAVWSDEDDYMSIGSLTTGSDGRLYLADGYSYYNRIYAVSVTGGTNDTFYLPDNASRMTSGSDGNLWFTMAGKIEKMTTTGARTEYDLPGGTTVYQLASGSDGVMWFLGGSKIGRISTTGVVTTYDLPDGGGTSSFAGLIAGSDGAMWFDYSVPNEGSKVGRLGY